jgi:hypothetical protein
MARANRHYIPGCICTPPGRRRNTILALDVLAEAAEAGNLEELANAHQE